MKIGIIITFIFLGSLLKAQVPTHLITLGGDSILYANSKFKFTEFIDARKDTTKLGLLKENYNSSSHQIINFPSDITQYLPSFINAVVDYSPNAEQVCVVVKTLELSEEPLGAIEIAKSKVDFHFYLKKDGKYKLIRVITKNREQPKANVTESLSAEMETIVRLAIYDFLTQPSTEGENSKWLSKSELLELEVPAKRIKVLPVGSLYYSGLHYKLNNKTIKRKEAIRILKSVDDPEIDALITKNRKNVWVTIVFSSVATGLVAYPIYDFAQNQGEFKGNYVMFGTGSAIISLLSAKAYRDNIREAIDMYNERYNE